MRLLLAGVAAAGILYSTTIGAQETDFEGRVDAVTLLAVLPALTAAARDSLPRFALEAKVLEGLAKNARPEQIAQVVTDLADEFRRARVAMRENLPGEVFRDGEVVAVATASRQGIGVDVMRALWTARDDGVSLEVPLTVLGELVRRGVPVDEAASLLSHVVETSVPMSAAAQIPGKFDVAVGAGASPAAALVQALRALNIPSRGRRPNG